MGRKIHDSWMSLDFYVSFYYNKKASRRRLFAIDIIHLL